MASPVQPLRVLVIDDEAAIRELLETVLQRDGYEVTTLEDPTRAAEVVREGRFHLCLLDLMMPRQDGLETLQKIRKIDRDLAVVIITGYPSLETAVESMKLDALDYLRKPFTVEDLRAVVERVLKKKGLTRTPEEQLHRVLGETIRNLRKERDLTLKQMAKRTGLSVSLLSQIERAESSASISSLYKIAVALDARVQELFGDF
ncbi:MAG: response regulator [Deltaproteobacteria bacterium]|nr:response regulator [Deltaproteobacteria bacterium]